MAHYSYKYLHLVKSMKYFANKCPTMTTVNTLFIFKSIFAHSIQNIQNHVEFNMNILYYFLFNSST